MGGAEDGRGLPGRSLRAQQPCGIMMEGRGSGGNEIGRVENTLTSASSPNTTLQPPRASPRARHVHSREHACASVGFLGLEGSCRRPRDRRGASRSQRQPAATLDARCEHPRQRGQLNPTQEPSAAARGRVAGACRTWSNRGTFRRDRTSGDSRRRHGGAPAPCSSGTPWRRGSPPTWWGAVEGKRSQPDGGRRTQSAQHARARTGLRSLRGSRRPPCDRREAPRRQQQPPDPATDTCEHASRCQPNPLLEPPAATRGRGPRACKAWANRGAFRRDLTARGPS